MLLKVKSCVIARVLSRSLSNLEEVTVLSAPNVTEGRL